MSHDDDEELESSSMHAPDWGRMRVKSNFSTAPVGDPTRWGATVVQNAAATALEQFLASDQIVQVGCRDSYSRAWSIIGTLTAPNTMWDFIENGPDGWASFLSITMGTGQTQIVHNINLRAVVEADAAVYYDSNPQFPFGIEGFRTRPFIMPGAMIGNTIAITAYQSLRFAIAPANVVPITTSLLVTPFAAGTQL